MLKSLVVLAVFCISVQASAPVLGQTPSRDAAPSKNPKHAADSTQKPTERTPAPTHPQKGDPPTLKSDPSQKKADDAPQSIAIPKPVTVLIQKDGMDWSAIANLILAAVGIVGIVVAICTLIKIERQTAATEKQADHMVASEGSWVTVEI